MPDPEIDFGEETKELYRPERPKQKEPELPHGLSKEKMRACLARLKRGEPNWVVSYQEGQIIWPNCTICGDMGYLREELPGAGNWKLRPCRCSQGSNGEYIGQNAMGLAKVRADTATKERRMLEERWRQR